MQVGLSEFVLTDGSSFSAVLGRVSPAESGGCSGAIEPVLFLDYITKQREKTKANRLSKNDIPVQQMTK